MSLILIGCGKSKRETASTARELYTGSLFRSRLAYAEQQERREGATWLVLSAGRGLLDPDEIVEPYDTTMRDLAPIDRAAWALSVALEILSIQPDHVLPRDLLVEIHAGSEYAEQLRDVLVAAGVRVSLPMAGMGIGEQRAWYARKARRGAA